MATGASDQSFDTTPETDFLKGGPQRVRGGPIAAMVATLGILAATAVPGAAPLPEATAGPRVLTEQPLGPAGLEGDAAIDLGPALGRFVLDGGSTVARLEGGARRLHLVLERDRGEQAAGFTGTLDLHASLAADRAAEEGLGVLQPRREADRTPTVRPLDGPAPAGAGAFRAVRGVLEGTGALEGHRLAVRLAPGAAAWEGPLADESRALAAPLVCFIEDTAAGPPEQDMVRGWLAVAPR